MKKKKHDDRNYLEFIPVRSELVSWSQDQAGKVTLDVENRGVFNWIAQKLFKKPRTSHIDLDELGSFVWQRIDGELDILALGELVKAEFGENAEPLYPRLAKYFRILESYHFVKWKQDMQK